MKSEENVKNELRQWISNKCPDDTDITDSLNVIETRIISSLDIMELILFIEQLKGEKFNLKNIKPGSFNSINSIYASFFGK